MNITSVTVIYMDKSCKDYVVPPGYLDTILTVIDEEICEDMKSDDKANRIFQIVFNKD